MIHKCSFRLLSLLICVIATSAAFAQTTAFTYQGKLTDAGNPANGLYDLQFKLFDLLSGGTQQGATLVRNPVAVSAGIFSVQLDFGANVFGGADRYLEIAVRPAGSANPYTVLAPRQPLTSTPYAIRTLAATVADGLSAACVGCVTSTQIGSLPADSGNYVQNSTAQQAGSNFNIDGDGTAGGTLTGNIVDAAAQYNLGGSRILSNPGSNNLFVGTSAGAAHTTSQRNTLLGVEAGMSQTAAVGNTFVGYRAGKQNTASFNTFIGDQAGSGNTAAASNTFVGFSAGSFNSGSDNAFFGFAAGQFNQAAFGNSFFGSGAGQFSTGLENAFFGFNAGQNNGTGNDNAIFGWSAGLNSTGSGNAFFGTVAGSGNTTGDYNTFIGFNTGNNTSTGQNNTFIGANANMGFHNLNYATAIGAEALALQSNSIILGRSGGADSVGIGLSLPARLLDVNGRARVRSIPLEASGAAVCFNASGDLLQCGASSLRLKRNVRPYRQGLDTVLRLRPISFTWKEDGRADFGLGAEEVARVAPELTFTNNQGEPQGVKYEKLSLLLINAVQELKAENKALRRRLQRLERRWRRR
jgi:hypothetical protein